jgi:hypothetical protein
MHLYTNIHTEMKKIEDIVTQFGLTKKGCSEQILKVSLVLCDMGA